MRPNSALYRAAASEPARQRVTALGVSRSDGPFQRRILDIDRRVAEILGIIMARAVATSVRLPTIDTLIAATAERHRVVIVTRNLRDFDFASVVPLSPWEARIPSS
jgi:predicted nucleic acid-binding protein